MSLSIETKSAHESESVLTTTSCPFVNVITTFVNFMMLSSLFSFDDYIISLVVYNVNTFRKAFCKAIAETRTYGQTNVRQIVECYTKLSEYNFRSVSSKEIVPFRFLDISSDEKQPIFDLKSEKVTEFISQLDSDYDRQLFLYMGIAINQYIKKNE